MVQKFQHILVLALCLATLNSCGWSETSSVKATTGRAPEVAEVPEADETVRGVEDPPIVTLEIGSRLKERRLTRSEELPDAIYVPTTNLNAVPVSAALQAVLEGTEISLSWDTGTLGDRLVSVSNLSGSLPRVVEKICSAARVFCGYRSGLLELKETETFAIELPAMATSSKTGAAATNTMADTIGKLAGQEVQIDTQGGNLIYTADVAGNERVREYMDQLRNGRPLVVMQMYIWEVVLDKRNAVGINWRSFKLPDITGAGQSLTLANAKNGTSNIATAFSSIASPGVSLGAKLSGFVDADSVLQFLATQGQVQTISNPQLTFVSGSNAEFRVGGKQNYISEVGQISSSNVSGSNTTNSGIGNNTVSTDTVETGLTIEISGAYEGGVVLANLDLTLQNLVRIENIQSGGTQIQLPVTSDRKVSTLIRVRPGDNLVLAGLVSSRDDNKREGIPLPFDSRVPTYSDDTLQNSELVILVKPSVVLFSDKKFVEDEEKADVMKKRGARQTLPDAVVIDGNGTQILKQPVEGRLPLPGAGATSFNQSSYVPSNDAGIANLNALPTEPLNNGTAPVNRLLLQRGFSHAFTDMMAKPEDGGRP